MHKLRTKFSGTPLSTRRGNIITSCDSPIFRPKNAADCSIHFSYLSTLLNCCSLSRQEIFIAKSKRCSNNKTFKTLHSFSTDSSIEANPSISQVNKLNNGKTDRKVTNSYSGSTNIHIKTQDSSSDLRQQLLKAYDDALHYYQSKKLPEDVNPKAVFACNRLNLRGIDIFGFDYDYTLACYRQELQKLIYDLGRDVLLHNFKYPDAIKKLDYNPNFAVRGLHYDIQKGLLMKVDSFMQIQMGSVYRGLTQLSDEEVLQLYGSRKIPMNYIESQDPHRSGADTKTMVQLADLFSVPEMNLLCNVAEYLHQNAIDFHPESLFRDVKESVQRIHPVMHLTVEKKPEMYLEYDPLLREYLTTLVENGKKVFLVTNSPFHFVHSGLTYIVGNDWKDFFDVIVVSARKPHFFSNQSIPFRLYDPDIDARLWDRVNTLEKGKIYYGGTLTQFQKLTGWKGDKVVYFGDHAYTDLADVTLHHGWRTGAIIKELESEIETLNSPDFKHAMNWLQFLTSLLETYQDLDDPDIQDIIKNWQTERNLLRKKTKTIFNEQFGSLFRTHLNPTFFSKRLFRFADIYTSSVTNLMKYSVRHTFYPRRGALPHEYRSWFN